MTTNPSATSHDGPPPHCQPLLPSSLTRDQLARAKSAYIHELETEWQTQRPESWARTADTADIQEVLRKHLWDETLENKMRTEGRLRRGALSVHVVANDWERALIARHTGEGALKGRDEGERQEGNYERG